MLLSRWVSNNRDYLLNPHHQLAGLGFSVEESPTIVILCAGGSSMHVEARQWLVLLAVTSIVPLLILRTYIAPRATTSGPHSLHILRRLFLAPKLPEG